MVISSVISKYMQAFVISLVILFLASNQALAVSGTISVEPRNGSFENDEILDASIVINGGGTQFNAAEAKVSLSENLRAERLTLGNCGFAFVDTPTTSNPSFTGVILGGSKSSCTLYTLRLRAIGGINGFVYISDGSIKSFQGAEELLSSVINSSYTISGAGTMQDNIAVATPTQPPLTNNKGEKAYTVIYTIEAYDSNVPEVSVIMDPQQQTRMISTVKPLIQDDSVLAAVFENVNEGVHTIEVRNKDRIVSSEVVNIEGEDREVSFGVRPETRSFSLASIAVAAITIIFVIAGGVLGYAFYWKKKNTVN